MVDLIKKSKTIGTNFIKTISFALILCMLSGCTKIEMPDYIPKTSDNLYAYKTLSEEEKNAYNSIYSTLLRQKSDAIIIPCDTQKVFFSVLQDHPEIFWCDGFKTKKEGSKIRVMPSYTLSRKEIDDYNSQLSIRVLDFHAKGNDYEKAKYIYEKLITETEYCDSDNSQNIVSALLNKQSVCNGYAKSFQYLLNKEGIEATTVSGFAAGVPHTWNLVKLDGEWYWFDVTWGDPTYTGKRGTVDYTYFAITTEELLRTHEMENAPECMATADNYYVKENKYAKSLDSAINTIKTGAETIKFDSRNLYDKAMSFFVDQGHIFDYINNKHLFVYKNNDMLTLNVVAETA